MKQAISYIRISNRDQSNFSLSGQQEYIKQFCERKGIILINSFLDNGQSAKNFDRADWRKLEQFVAKNHKDIDYLVVVKYDRFSRNVVEGLNMIERLEKKYQIAILSVFEEISIDTKSPFFFKMRTDMLVQAEFELRVIRDRTNFGIRQAKREGRWIGRAPFGYLNKKEGGKPGIIPDPERAEMVRKAFELFNSGISMMEIRAMIKAHGHPIKGNSIIARMLQNPVYLGMLNLDGEWIKGKHPPIIDLQTFNKAQEPFAKETKIRVIINDEVPLRGVLKCSCGRHLTAGRSKGKTNHYWYYKCKSHLEVNFNSKVVHEKMREVMFHLSLSEQTIDAIRLRAEQKLKIEMSKRSGKVPDIKRDITEVEKKIVLLEEKFILNQLPFKSYSTWNSAYNTELSSLKRTLEASQQTDQNLWTIYRKESEKLSDMLKVYDGLNAVQKQRLLNLVFNRDLMYRLNSFLTSKVHALFEPNALKLKEKGLLIINSPSGQIHESAISSGIGNLVELFELVSLSS